MRIPMNELALSKDTRCEARRIRLVDRDDPHFRQISRSRVPKWNGVQGSIGVALDSKDFSRKCIALADCEEFLSTGLCFYDEGEAAGLCRSWFVVLKPMDIERWKCAALLLKQTLSLGTCADYDGLLERYEPDWRPLHERRVDLGIAVCVLFVCVEWTYGGLHALAWNSDFGSTCEQFLWRCAVVCIVAFGPLFVVVLLTWEPDERKVDMEDMCSLKNTIIGRALGLHRCTLAWWVGLQAILIVSIPLSVLVRIFLTVECLTTLFRSAPGVFEEPSWSAYFPHIT